MKGGLMSFTREVTDRSHVEALNGRREIRPVGTAARVIVGVAMLGSVL